MKTISGREMCKILQAKGWKIARISGSHHVFIMQGKNIRISVPVHANKDLKIGLQKAIMKLANISENEL
jgi:predicted RNA binding protein YcfA (HicA-like mRNA interferase family)